MQKNFEVNIEHTINSGQVFLWEKIDDKWYGIDGKKILVINKKIDSKNSQLFKFFRLDDDFQKIKRELSIDKNVKKSISNFPGMRLLRQDPFQCYISFIVSSNSNIPNIQTRLKNLCKKFGEKKIIQNKEFFLFPNAKKLVNASIKEITDCGLGYRSKYVKEASKAVENGEIDFSDLNKMDYFSSREQLCSVFGIGKKVADCILLFSLEKLEAVPLDRWVIRILQKYYKNEFEIKTKTITDKTYDDLHERIIEHFGRYAGYAQQFLFKNEREIFEKKWLR